ncbi:MAG: alcohol dehydrogenase catalytic domain-containing protein [Planctomycetaceae bacterium]|nr:alcohol dehydrogenase catalytic domain-containing protein [Planctomycetaceae bacterium]
MARAKAKTKAVKKVTRKPVKKAAKKTVKKTARKMRPLKKTVVKKAARKVAKTKPTAKRVAVKKTAVKKAASGTASKAAAKAAAPHKKLPATQYAVQLVGPDKLTLNASKAVHEVGPYGVLARIESVGLCFSDLKLLKQFDQHPRKSGIVSGIDAAALPQMPSYVPGDKPTVPGHEVTCVIVAVGPKVKRHKVGERCLVQTDYRWLKTDKSNAAFGYNFEGGLQQYVLMDERVIIDPQSGQRMLIPVDRQRSASAICLVEPWACVEDSYVTPERRGMMAGGKLLVVAEAGYKIQGIAESLNPDGKPAVVLAKLAQPDQLADLRAAVGMTVVDIEYPKTLEPGVWNDIVYFGTDPAVIELLNDKLAPGGIMNIVTAGKTIGRAVEISVGRVHYGMCRWVGTTGANAADGYKMIPADGEVRDNDSVIVIGAGGPMGQMHVIRDVCSGKKNLSVVGTDFDDARLATLGAKVAPLAAANGVTLKMINPNKQGDTGTHSYHAIMAPVPALVSAAIAASTPGALINIFAGIAATVKHPIDLDAVVSKSIFMFGTSGSTIRDMMIVLEKVQAGTLDTNASVDAVSGMAGAIDGIAAVENRTLAGKIIVYPQLVDLPLTPLSELKNKLPAVAAKLDPQGQWTKAAEETLLKQR